MQKIFSQVLINVYKKKLNSWFSFMKYIYFYKLNLL